MVEADRYLSTDEITRSSVANTINKNPAGVRDPASAKLFKAGPSTNRLSFFGPAIPRTLPVAGCP